MNLIIHSIKVEKWGQAHNTIMHTDTIPVTLGSEAVLQAAELTFRGLVNVEVYTDVLYTFFFEFKVFTNNDHVSEIEKTIDTVMDEFKNKKKLHSIISTICSLMYNNEIPMENPKEDPFQ